MVATMCLHAPCCSCVPCTHRQHMLEHLAVMSCVCIGGSRSLLCCLYCRICSIQLTLDIRKIVRFSSIPITFPLPTTFTLPPSSRCHQVRWQASKRGSKLEK